MMFASNCSWANLPYTGACVLHSVLHTTVVNVLAICSSSGSGDLQEARAMPAAELVNFNSNSAD